MAVQSFKASNLPYNMAKRGYDIEIARLRARLNDPSVSAGDRVTVKAKIAALEQKIRAGAS